MKVKTNLFIFSNGNIFKLFFRPKLYFQSQIQMLLFLKFTNTSKLLEIKLPDSNYAFKVKLVY